jgi:SAM-dependent methyltransferase
VTATADERVERERRFHDDRFADDPRARIDRVYDVAARATAEYEAEALSAGRNGTVLELGCGADTLAGALVAREADVVGIDISPVAVELATARTPAARFEVMNAESTTFADGRFDAVVGSGILHHLDLDAAAAELARILDPAGTAVFLEPLGHNPFVNLYRRLTPDLRTEDEHPLLVDDLRRLQRDFAEVDVTFHVLAALAAVPATRLGRLGRLVARGLDRLDQVLFRLVPPLRRFAWIVVIRLRRPVPGR